MNTSNITNTATTARFARPENVVWRLAPDRVLVRRVGDLTDDGCADLIGFAAAVWVGLDEPASLAELTARLADADIDTADANYTDALAALVERGWVEQIDDEPDTQVGPPDPAAHDW